MRIQMRPKGLRVAVRGSITKYNPVTGSFTVLFDVRMENPIAMAPGKNKPRDGAPPPPIPNPSSLDFLQAGNFITDTTFGLTWEVMSQ